MSEEERVPSDEAMRVAYEFLFSTAMKHCEKAATMRWEDIGPFYQGLLKESDRAIGILAFTFIESQVYEMFANQLDPEVQGGLESILGPQGILDGVGAQIRMLRALQWITPETEHNLKLLARIRNRFAHSHSVLTFGDEKIRGYFDSLTPFEVKFPEKGAYEKYRGVNLQARHRYLVRAIGTLFQLYHDLSLMPSSIRAGMGSRGAFGGDFEKFPTALRNALAICFDTYELIVKDAAGIESENSGLK